MGIDLNQLAVFVSIDETNGQLVSQTYDRNRDPLTLENEWSGTT